MDPSYQAGQSSNPIRKPDLKKKLAPENYTYVHGMADKPLVWHKP